MGGAYGWRVMAVVAGVVLGAATLVGCGSGTAERVVLAFDTGAEGAAQHRAAAAECSRGSGGRYTIEQRTQQRRDTDDQRLQLARRLAAHDASLDIMELDVI